VKLFDFPELKDREKIENDKDSIIKETENKLNNI
jgi:hypothetical protein